MRLLLVLLILVTLMVYFIGGEWTFTLLGTAALVGAFAYALYSKTI